ncbi:MAG: YdcF family protein [Patescibacteria group bacterium]|jgi:uncharacterized SAM-binding protein YcdF (DUF218 family)
MNRLVKFLEKQIAFSDAHLSSIAADVIIGIGTGVSSDGNSCSLQSAAIADRVLQLFRAGRAKNVLLIGGNFAPEGRFVESRVMANRIGQYLPEDKLFLECLSRNTRQNAEFSLEMAKKNGWQSAIIVAQPIHALRVHRTFRKLWMDQFDWCIHCRVVTAPSEYGGNSRQRMRNFFFFFIWDRLIAMPIFKLRGWI